jgi:hypothetical protein
MAKAYAVTIHTTEVYEATVIANSANEAREMARRAEWVDIYSCDTIIRNTIKRVVRLPEGDPLVGADEL